jgi:hypothetical protein
MKRPLLLPIPAHLPSDTRTHPPPRSFAVSERRSLTEVTFERQSTTKMLAVCRQANTAVPPPSAGEGRHRAAKQTLSANIWTLCAKNWTLCAKSRPCAPTTIWRRGWSIIEHSRPFSSPPTASPSRSRHRQVFGNPAGKKFPLFGTVVERDAVIRVAGKKEAGERGGPLLNGANALQMSA